MRKSRLSISLLVLTLWPVILYGQSAERFTVNAAGFSHALPTMNIDYSIGEIVVTTISNANITLTQGFHQPLDIAVFIREIDENILSLTCYPNPTSDYLVLEFSLMNSADITYSLADMMLRPVLAKTVKNLNPGKHKKNNSYGRFAAWGLSVVF